MQHADPSPRPSLDIEQAHQLQEYLRATGRIAADETVHMRVLAGGVSNRTVLVERGNGQAWVLKQALPKLRVAVDWFSDPARIEREALGMRYLAQLAPPGCITPLIFEDRANHLLAMEAVPQPHENWKTMLLRGDVQMEQVEQFATLLGTIHRRAMQSSKSLATLFDDRRFFESLRLEPYYVYTAEQVPAAREFLFHLVGETRKRTITLAHGDFSPKNILVHDGRLILLDHEVIHWGDPAFDVGFAMAHFLSKWRAFPPWRKRFIAAGSTFVRIYSQVLGTTYWNTSMQEMAVRHTLGCLLARVSGRSPLEYLNSVQRRKQRESVVAFTYDVPKRFDDLIFDYCRKGGVRGPGPRQDQRD